MQHTSRGNKNDLYVLGKTSEDGSGVLCVTHASRIKTLPLFSDRDANSWKATLTDLY
jgi:hypothetical protein